MGGIGECVPVGYSLIRTLQDKGIDGVNVCVCVCCVVLCCVVLCCVVLRCVVLCCVMLCCMIVHSGNFLKNTKTTKQKNTGVPTASLTFFSLNCTQNTW